MVRFDEGIERYQPVATFDEQFPFSVPMLFPYWSKIDIYGSFCSNSSNPQDCFFDYVNRSAVFYQVYTEDSNEPNASYILDRASQEVMSRNMSQLFSSFSASWVLVVTWLRLRPRQEFEGDIEEGIVSVPKIQ